MSAGKFLKSKAAKLTAVGLSIGLLFGGAASVPEQPDINDIQGPAPIVQTLDQAPLPPDPVLEISDEAEDEKKQRSVFWSFLSAPAAALGWLMCRGFELLWSTLLSPVISRLLFWLCIALVALGAVALGLKAAFPDTPLKELITKKRVFTVILSVMGLCAVFALLPLIWDGWERYAEVLRCCLSFVVLLALTAFFASKIRRRKENGHKTAVTVCE